METEKDKNTTRKSGLRYLGDSPALFEEFNLMLQSVGRALIAHTGISHLPNPPAGENTAGPAQLLSQASHPEGFDPIQKLCGESPG